MTRAHSLSERYRSDDLIPSGTTVVAKILSLRQPAGWGSESIPFQIGLIKDIRRGSWHRRLQPDIADQSEQSSTQIKKGSGVGERHRLAPKPIRLRFAQLILYKAYFSMFQGQCQVLQSQPTPPRHTFFRSTISPRIWAVFPEKYTSVFLLPMSLYSHEYTSSAHKGPYPAPKNDCPPVELCRIQGADSHSHRMGIL
jgi:hypothetical protein